MLGESSQMLTTKRTAIRRRLAVRRATHGPPWSGWKAGHRTIVAPLATTVAATLAASLAIGVGVALARAERDRRWVRAAGGSNGRAELFPAETLADELRHTALGQLDHAIRLLGAEDGTAPAGNAVHETRKAIKRLRALMRLLREQLGEKGFARENSLLRDAGLRLAGARDAQVRVITLDALIERHPKKLARRRGVSRLRSQLVLEREQAMREAYEDDLARAEVLDELRALRERVEEWGFPRQEGIAIVAPGLRSIYRQGDSRRRRAARSSRRKDAHAMHQWRKRVKDLRYAAETLDRGEPLHRLARRADRLGELLGEDHDLAMLAEHLGAPGENGHSHAPAVGAKTRKLLLKLIARRRRRLRRRALIKGERLYALEPKRFVRRVGDAYARASRV
jgi:CHAD domain-containing protein